MVGIQLIVINQITYNNNIDTLAGSFPLIDCIPPAGVFFLNGNTVMSKKVYWDKLEDLRWKVKRNRIIERDEGRCCDCGLTSENLHVHHLIYHGEPWEVEDKYLVTLCDRCHFYRHNSNGRIGGPFSIGEILKAKYHD